MSIIDTMAHKAQKNNKHLAGVSERGEFVKTFLDVAGNCNAQTF